MWIPSYIRFTNLFSHSDTTYKFNVGSMDLMLGINLDDIGSNSNGSGKSGIIEAITLAIDGTVFRGVNKEDFIKYGEDHCTVDFGLHNPVLNATLEIKRKIFNNTKSAKLEVYYNGKFPEDIPTATNGGVDVRLGNANIYKQLGITREDFLNFYVIGQGNTASFFTTNDVKQKEIISRFSNFTGIDALLKELEAKDTEIGKEIGKFQSNVDTCDELIEFFKQEIEDKRENFTDEKSQLIGEKRNQAKEINDNIKKIAEKAENNQKTIEVKSSELEKISIPDSKEISSTIAKIETKIDDFDQNNDEAREVISNLKSKRGEAVQCPKCEYKFVPDEDMCLQEIEDMITNVEQIIKDNKDEQLVLKKRLGIQKTKLGTITEQKSKKRTLGNEISSFQEILENQKSDLKRYKKNLETIHKELVEIGKKNLKSEICEIESKLAKQEDKRAELLNSIQGLQDVRDELQFHIFHFGKKGFKTYLANKSIRTIQDICNYYLQKFETNLQVQISGYTILKNGDIRDKIEISVLKNGLNKGLLAKYSGGEKSRVNVAGIIAVNRLINNGCGDLGLDLLILDENVSGLDSSGQTEIIRILAKSKITTILVMHQVDDIPYKHKVYVKKENGNSKIVSVDEYSRN